MSFRRLRILLLLLVLLTVALSAWRTGRRLNSWQDTLQVVVYPLNADGQPTTRRYIDSLQETDFTAIADYLAGEGKRYGLNSLYPVRVTLAPAMSVLPPVMPQQANALEAMRWSLSLRYWAWKNASHAGIRPDIRLFVLYHDPEVKTSLPDSAGLNKGQIVIAHLFATRAMHGSNLVVATHELLHALGASDKYDRSNNQPLFPAGFADPQQDPAYPQTRAELMAGRIPLAPDRAETPKFLLETLIGPESAREIGWIRP